jgi:hypothetical protein
VRFQDPQRLKRESSKMMLALGDQHRRTWGLLGDLVAVVSLFAWTSDDLFAIDSQSVAVEDLSFAEALHRNMLAGETGWVVGNSYSRGAVAAGRPQNQCRVYLGYPGFWDRLSFELWFRKTQVRGYWSQGEIRN